jgi:hypothetical protein
MFFYTLNHFLRFNRSKLINVKKFKWWKILKNKLKKTYYILFYINLFYFLTIFIRFYHKKVKEKLLILLFLL